MEGASAMLMLFPRNQEFNIKLSRGSSHVSPLLLRICHCFSSEPETTMEGHTVHPHADSKEHGEAQRQLSSFPINHWEEGDRWLPGELGRYHRGAG